MPYGKRNKPVVLECCFCGKEFETTSPHRKYCTDECRKNAVKERNAVKFFDSTALVGSFTKDELAVAVRDLIGIDSMFAAAAWGAPPQYRPVCKQVHEKLQEALKLVNV